MTWGPTLYAQVTDAAAVSALAAQLGIDVMPDGSLSTGNANFALVSMDAPWAVPPVTDEAGEVITPGERMGGVWFMGRLNDAWPGAEQAMATLAVAGVLRELADPPMVWAGAE